MLIIFQMVNLDENIINVMIKDNIIILDDKKSIGKFQILKKRH